jgi:phosphate transport system protein
MVFGFKRDGDADRLDRIEALLQRMIADDAHAFGLAMDALLGRRSPHEVGAELRSTDHRVNEAEREIRRELIVHASVQGAIDTLAILVYMSIVKDIERIGDYAKNLFDLADDGARLTSGPLAAELAEHAESIPRFMAASAECFRDRDLERARELLPEGDVLLDRFDSRVSALVRGDASDPEAVATALANRYLKRIVAHLMNLLSAVVMPVDRLDYFDEDPEDRA